MPDVGLPSGFTGKPLKQKVHNQYKKVRKEGGARVLALTPFIPKDWKLVKINQVHKDLLGDEGAIYLRIERVV